MITKMNPDCEKLLKNEVPELDALLTKPMLYLQSVTDSEPDDKVPKLNLELKNLPSEEELLRRF
jgi:hypothetical protein